MLRKLILALSFSSLAAFSGSVLAAAFDITDIEGRKVHFEDQPKTFVVANYIANFMMVGGAAGLEKVVALTKDGWEDTRYGEYQVFTKSFPKMKDLPSIGGYHDDILNAEKILSLHPDVLLIGRTQYAENSQRIKTFEKAGIKVVVLDYHAMTTVNHTLSTEILGKLLGRERIAEAQNKTYKEALDHVYSTIVKLPDDQVGTKVYMETASKGLARYGNSYNKDVLWGAILKNIKAANLAENSPQPYMALDKEYVISQNPKVIFIGGSIWRNKSEGDQMRMGFTVPESQAQERLANFTKRPGWNMLDAVKENRVYGVDHGSLRNMADYTFTQYMAKVLYPEAFKDIDTVGNLNNYYKTYLPELKYDGTFMIHLNQK